MRRGVLLAVTATLLLTACTSNRPVRHLTFAWSPVDLPTDPRGRSEVRAITACDDRVWLSGAILTSAPPSTTPPGEAPNPTPAQPTTAPALWVADGGGPLRSVRTEPRSAYGPTHVLYSVACRGRDAVAVGESNGGAHGNARVNTWLSVDAAGVTEIPSPFELYNGPNALGVGTVTGGPAGYVVVGARTTSGTPGGAAVWTSPDGKAFTLVDRDPALASDSRGSTEVHAATATPTGFVAVGGITPPHAHLGARDPIAWRSTDGLTWTRDTFPTTPGDDVLLDVAAYRDGAVAVGAEGDAFRIWTLTGGRWQAGARFGSVGGGDTVPAVPSIAVAPDGRVFVVVSDTLRYRMFVGSTEVDLPATIAAAPVLSGPRVVAATIAGGRLVLATDDGQRARVFTAPI